MTLLRAGLLALTLAHGSFTPAAIAQDDEGGGVIDDRSAHERDADARTGRLDIPRNDGWVTDLADLLTPDEERELETLMESYKQGTAHEIALLTVPSLQGEPIERFALDVFREWGIGSKDTSNGALLVVSKSDRSLRIEVGRGLEGTLTDSISGRIIRDVIVPRFKDGRFGEGLKQGVLAIHEAIGGDYGRIERTPRKRRGAPWLPIVLFPLLLILARARRRGGRGRRRRSWLSPGWGPFIGGTSLGGSSWGGSDGGGGGFSGGGFSGFGGGGGASGGGASGRW